MGFRVLMLGSVVLSAGWVVGFGVWCRVGLGFGKGEAEGHCILKS